MKKGTRIGAYRRKEERDEESEDEDGSWMTGSTPSEMRQRLKSIFRGQRTMLETLESLGGDSN